jgi:hypothetical protein
MNSKRGQGLSTNAIILIILGVIILVILILGFTVGWNQILPFLQENNVQTIVNACNLECSQGNQYNFCTYPRTLNDGTDKFPNVSCYDLANEEIYSIYGIDKCPAIPCSETAE